MFFKDELVVYKGLFLEGLPGKQGQLSLGGKPLGWALWPDVVCQLSQLQEVAKCPLAVSPQKVSPRGKAELLTSADDCNMLVCFIVSGGLY